MTTSSVITPELKALLNKPGEREVFDVEKGRVKFFAQAIGDENPIYTDPEFAASTRFHDLIAPPLFLMDSGLSTYVEYILQFNPLTANINGGSEVEYFLPIKVGDTITTEPMITSLEEKDGRSGKLLLVTVQVTFHNQNGDLVSRIKNTFVWR